MPSLRQLLLEQSRTPQGIHEALARYSESLFSAYKGVVPLAFGVRRVGPYLNLTLPQPVALDRPALLELIANLVVAHNLNLISLIVPIASDNADKSAPQLAATLVTASESNGCSTTSWMINYDAEGEIKAFNRAPLASYNLGGDAYWASLFRLPRGPEPKSRANAELDQVFGS